MQNMNAQRLIRTSLLLLSLGATAAYAQIAPAQILSPQKNRRPHVSKHSSGHSSEHSSTVFASERPYTDSAKALTRPTVIPDVQVALASSRVLAQDASHQSSLIMPSKLPPEFARPSTFNTRASFNSQSARFDPDHLVPDGDLMASSAFAPSPAPPHDNIADRLNDPEFYAHHIPGVGPIMEKVIQKSKAHPRLTHVFEVIQPEF